MWLRGGQAQTAAPARDESQENKLAALRARLGTVPPAAGRPIKHSPVSLRGRLKKLLIHPYMLVVIVLLGWYVSFNNLVVWLVPSSSVSGWLMRSVFVVRRGFSEYFLVLTGRAVNWQTGMFYNCLGVITINLFTFQSGAVDLFRFDRWAGYAVLTGILYGGADLYFLKLSGNKNISHMADVSVLAPLCSLYILIPTLLGIFVDTEPLTKRKGFGILLATLAILLLSFEEQEAGSTEGGEAAGGVVEDEPPTNDQVGSHPRMQPGP